LSAPRFRFGELDPLDRLDAFDCGDPARNDWLRRRAAASQASDDARTTLILTDLNEVAGFCAITVGSVLRDSLPGPLRRNAPNPVGCILLAQLGVALRFQGQGLGREMVLHAMHRAAEVAAIAGARLLVVQPSTPALRTYCAKFGLREAASDPPLMAMSLQMVCATLAAEAAG
jgi:ribosomal protein S18 acetylase RimI-like enzyme